MVPFKSLFVCCLLFSWRFANAIENSKENGSKNIGDFVGQLTSLLNQGAGGQLGDVVGYQSPGFPPYPPPPPGAPYPPYHQIPPGAPYPPPYQQYPTGYPGGGLTPSPSSLIGALASIARYDDLRCVPRLLCEVASGSRPGSYGYPSYSQESPVPFLSKDAVVTLLTVLNFVDDSPLLVFGRAALLGYTARGDSRACLTAYPTCPKDPEHLVDYLNNHNGGFFRFFNQQIQQYAPQYQQYHPHPPHFPPPYPPPNLPYPPQYSPQRPYPLNRPPPPLYSPQRPTYSQRPRPYPGYPQQYSSQHQRYQSRIQNQPDSVIELNHYTLSSSPNPLAEEINHLSISNTNYQNYQDYYFNEDTKSKFVFPQKNEELSYNKLQSSRGGKRLFFPTDGFKEHFASNSLPFEHQTPMVFPDRTGTGHLRLDLDEHGDYKTVHYESLKNSDRDLRQVKFPQEYKMHFPQ